MLLCNTNKFNVGVIFLEKNLDFKNKKCIFAQKEKRNTMGQIIQEAFEKVIKEYEIKKSDAEHVQQAMSTMDQNLEEQDKPKVGIFWYSEQTKTLFGVVAVDKDSFSQPNAGGGLITCKELHKNVWAKGFNKQKYKLGGIGPFRGDYKDTPRGRVFYNPTTDKYIINVGSWIMDNTECIDEVLDEFNLTNTDFSVEIAEHWEIGCGYDG